MQTLKQVVVWNPGPFTSGSALGLLNPPAALLRDTPAAPGPIWRHPGAHTPAPGPALLIWSRLMQPSLFPVCLSMLIHKKGFNLAKMFYRPQAFSTFPYFTNKTRTHFCLKWYIQEYRIKRDQAPTPLTPASVPLPLMEVSTVLSLIWIVPVLSPYKKALCLVGMIWSPRDLPGLRVWNYLLCVWEKWSLWQKRKWVTNWIYGHYSQSSPLPLVISIAVQIESLSAKDPEDSVRRKLAHLLLTQ